MKTNPFFHWACVAGLSSGEVPRLEKKKFCLGSQ